MAKEKQGKNYFHQIISFENIIFSKLPSQERRRSRFEEPAEIAKMRELADSIRANGILQFPTVRVLPDRTFELVFGERRIRAAMIAGLSETECIVRDLSDEQAAELQLIENIQRRDLHPVDEAFAYADMLTRLQCDENEIALRTGKDAGYVKNCLKLLSLDETILKLFEENLMGFQHALEFAKYPTAQKELLQYCFNNYGYDSQSLRPFSKFVESIKKHHLMQLKKAPFSTKSTYLRADGLACIECPSRTNAEPLLFEENFGTEDSCLDRQCWNNKATQHIHIQRSNLAEAKFGAEKAEKNVKKIPLITEEYWYQDSQKPKEPVLLKREWHEIKSKKDNCDSSEQAIFYDGDRIGQTQLICKDPKCKNHLGQYSSSSSSSKDPEKESEERRIRKEEIFDVKVGEAVRKRVLKKCAEIFAAQNGGKFLDTTGISSDFFISLIHRLWHFQQAKDNKTQNFIAEIAAEWLELEKDKLPHISGWNFDSDDTDFKVFRKFLSTIKPELYPRLLFLFLHAYKGEMFYGNWKSQLEIRELAVEFKLDYQKLDAEERLGAAAMKNKDLFRDYLRQMDEGKRDIPIPRIWSNKWKPKD